jgi:hypothetical protein
LGIEEDCSRRRNGMAASRKLAAQGKAELESVYR